MKHSKLHYLMFFLSMAAMTGCGANNAGTSAAINSSAPGGVAAKLQWQSGTAGSAKAAARALASTIPANVTSIQFTVTGTGANGAIPVVKSTVAASSSQASVNGVYPGTVAVAVKAVDTNGKALYEGYAINVGVAAGATTDVGTITMSAPIVKADEVNCLGCHETALDKTGQSIVANYKQSGHYTNTTFVDANGQGAGCAGCHGKSHNTPDPSANNGARCFECHNLGGAATTIVAEHGAAGTGMTYLANGQSCTDCHQFHNSAAANMERKSYAGSRHGATDLAVASSHATGSCSRCHSGAGFKASLANPTAPLVFTGVAQMITCDSCHTNAPLGTVRALAGTTGNPFATYTTSTKGYQFAPNNTLNPNKKAYYPDVAGSNLCVVCHSGTREGSATTKAFSDPYFVNFSTSKIVTPHNLPAAATMYVKFGFTNLSTGTAGVPTQAYLDSLTSDLDSATGKVTSTHRKFGTSAITADSHFSASHPAPANLKTNGPCATCHLSGSHSLKIDQAAINAVCSNCHSSEAGKDISTEASFLANFIEPQKEVYINALELGCAILNQKLATAGVTNVNFYISPVNGKFTVGNNTLNTVKNDGTYNSVTTDLRDVAAVLGYSTGKTGRVAITNVGQQKFMGAISNLAFFSADQGGFAHARTYSRRLIYDSLDFLDDGKLNLSVSASAVNVAKVATINGFANPVYNLYKKGSLAYTDSSLNTLGSGTTEQMIYLIGWSRSGATAGQWNAVERP